MFVYYNPNPAEKEVGDCVIRAIAKALNKGWEEAYIELCLKGYEMRDMPNSNAVWGAYPTCPREKSSSRSLRIWRDNGESFFRV